MNPQETKIVRKLFLSLLPVQAMAVGLPAINSLLDAVFVGNLLGQDALAAIGFTGPLTLLLNACISLVSTGAMLLCGRRMGTGDKKGVKNVFNTALLLCLLLGFVISGIMFFFPGVVSALLGASGESSAATAAYLQGWSIGVIFAMLVSCLLPFAQLERMSKTSTASVTVMLVFNLSFDYLCAAVWNMGIFGIGLATTISNVAALAVLLFPLLKTSRLFRISPASISFDTAVQILYQGAPSAVTPLCLLVRNRVMNQFIFALGGTAAMSAMAVADKFKNAVGGAVQAGYNGSGRLIASVLAGQRDSSSLRDLPRVMIRSGGVLYAACYAAVFVFARPIALLFGADAQNLELYILALRVCNLFYLLDIFKAPPACVYQALGKVKFLLVLNTLDNAVIPVLLCLLFANRLGLTYVFAVNSLAVVVVLLLHTCWFTWQAKRLPRSPAELAYIPSTLSAPRENRMKGVLRTVEDCTTAAAQAEAFCLSKGMTPRDAMYCGLCIEEMAVDTVTNRFPDDSHTLDLRMIYEDGSMTILLRDDCKQFDPKAWLDLCTPEDSSRSIGIRMVTRLAKEMNYTTALGLNVLTIRI